MVQTYPSNAKLQKQLKYANDRNVQFVALIGEQEMQQEQILLKNLETCDQESVSLTELINKLK